MMHSRRESEPMRAAERVARTRRRAQRWTWQEIVVAVFIILYVLVGGGLLDR